MRIPTEFTFPPQVQRWREDGKQRMRERKRKGGQNNMRQSYKNEEEERYLHLRKAALIL